MDWEAAWLACAIDGEGTIRHEHSNNTPDISVYNKSKAFCIRCAEIAGFGRTRESNEIWRWTVTKWSEINTILKRILPYMIIKRKHGQLLFKVSDIHQLYQWTEEEKELLKQLDRIQGHQVRKKDPVIPEVRGGLSDEG